jgi:hypothetical protein
MKEKDRTHWVMQEIADQEADRRSIDLWPRLETRLASLIHPARVTIRRKKIERLAFAFVLGLLVLAFLFIVPEVRAFTESVFQHMGIAFVNTDQFGDHVTVQQAEMTLVTPPPSLSMEEVRQRISFNLMLPAWLPDDLIYVYRSIREYDPADTPGSGQKVSIEYGRAGNLDPEGGLLRLTANDGPISSPPLLAASREQAVTVNSRPGIYVHGSWQDDGRGDPNTKMGSLLWDDHADDAYLTWTQAGVTYLLEAHNLGLGFEDLLRIAGSMSGQ